MSCNSPSSAQTHILDFGKAGRATLAVTFQEREIFARLDQPTGLIRRDRRHLARWLRKIATGLSKDHRPMRLQTFCGGQAKFVGFELGSLICGFYNP